MKTGILLNNLIIIKVTLTVIFTLAVLANAGKAQVAGRPVSSDKEFISRRETLGETEKFRIMVDKVERLDNPDGHMTEEHVKMYTELGFNVLVPRTGAEDYGYVRKMAKLARKYNAFYMPWMRGGTETKEDTPESEKIVWQGGVVQGKYNPNSDSLWEWLSERILTYAKISVEEPALIGVFLDYENYGAPHGAGWLYSISYDKNILEKFAKSKKIKFPKLSPEERHSYLENEGLLEDFRSFQIEHWRSRCRTLRKKIDAINPQFQFCIYPMSTFFMREAAWQEFSTKDAPLIVADASTYGRPGGMTQQVGLEHHAEKMRKKMKFLEEFEQKHEVPMLLLGGIDPIVYRAPDAEFAGKNAVVISENCNGYWVFYELREPVRTAYHNAYLEWFTLGNQAIVKGRYGFWREDRKTLDIFGPRIVIDKFDSFSERFTVKLEAIKGTSLSTEIRYTLDGSEPTCESPKYIAPITTKLTTVKAAFFKDREPLSAASVKEIDAPINIIEDKGGSLQDSITEFISPEVTDEKIEYPTVKLRGENILLVAGKAGHSIELSLQNQPVAQYEAPLWWELCSPSSERIDFGMIPYRKTGTVKFTPERDGIYLLGASAKNCAYSVISSTAPVGLYTGNGLSLIYGAERLYFKVPSSTEKFTLAVKGADAETVRLNVFNPEDNQVAEGQTTLKKIKTEFSVSARDYEGETWSLELTQADEGVLEDSVIELGPELPPVLSFTPEHVFDID